MARQPLLRSALRAFSDDWPAGPGQSRPLARIGAWARWATIESALLPDRDPPGPTPAHILLGSHFFTHHTRLRLSLRYSDIEYDPANRRPRAFSACGEIVA